MTPSTLARCLAVAALLAGAACSNPVGVADAGSCATQAQQCVLSGDCCGGYYCLAGVCTPVGGIGGNGGSGTPTSASGTGVGASSGSLSGAVSGTGASSGSAASNASAASSGNVATLTGSAAASSGTTASPVGASGTSNGTTVGVATSSSGTTGASGSTGSTGVGTGSSGSVCTNLQCDVVPHCADGGDTTISGTIMDPAGVDPLYNVVAYVPNTNPEPLPTGATCATCASLFTGDPMADGLSDADGHFVIAHAPVAATVPVILQVGKWRTHTSLSVAACQDNPVGTMKFPSEMDPSDPIINLPDIAVSTGGADSLECLLTRMGISASEYVPGTSTAGKVHIFNGGDMSTSNTGAGGLPEANLMSGAPASDQALWNSSSSMEPYDLVLLSCEGDETYDAMPNNLESYLNTQGGRVFASHYHYAWFTGATEGQTPSYTPPTDWGTGGDALASWTPGSNSTADGSANTTVVTTLSNGGVFPKGQAFDAWLGNVQALGVVPPGAAGTCVGLTSDQLCVAEMRENASVTVADTGSQAWITDPAATSAPTLYFSFNTPLNAIPTDGGGCPGRAVYSDLHVGGASYDSVNCTNAFGIAECPDGPQTTLTPAPPPAGCDTTHGLTPQEKALEFMIFDLSSCVVPDTANPADAGIKLR